MSKDFPKVFGDRPKKVKKVVKSLYPGTLDIFNWRGARAYFGTPTNWASCHVSLAKDGRSILELPFEVQQELLAILRLNGYEPKWANIVENVEDSEDLWE